MNPTEIDSALLPYWLATDEEEAQRVATQLLREDIEPTVKRIVFHKLGLWLSLRRDEVADVQSEIILQLLGRLQQLRQGINETPIKNLRAYVAVTSYRGCASYLRRQYPNRWRLLNRVRYLLTSQPQFVLQQDENEQWAGGLAVWHREQALRQPLGREQARLLIDGPLPASLAGVPDPSFTRVRAEDQLQAILQWAARFVGLDELVAILAHWWGIKDQASADLDEPSDPQVNVGNEVEQRQYLQKLWREIVLLPVRQRQALLLNLRDTGNQEVITLLPALQITSLRGIAAVLNLPAEEFAEVWARLPLADSEIAERMQVTRRQVINLRKAARERLVRRARSW
ncbi:MAG: hypothetical protein JST84_25750 [Acidobacteria bacterium]|nr:hypothetical protein [Acidobacteriota bacterium]